MVEAVDQLVGYRMLELLAKNPNTEVEMKAAMCLSTGKEVAVKCLDDDSIEEIKSLVKEGLIQGRVDHENNCRLLEMRLTRVGITSPTWAVRLIMEKMPKDVKKDMKDRMKLRRPYTEAELLHFLSDVSKGLAHAKMNASLTQKIAHLDLKPENIFLDSEGNYKVGDFGSAWEKLEHESTVYGAGTPPYMSPELRNMLTDSQRRFKHKPFQSDVFSLGMTLFALTRLSRPPKVRNEAAITNEIRGLPYSERFKTFLQKMLQVNPENRPTIEGVVAFADPAQYEEQKQTLHIEEEKKVLSNARLRQSIERRVFLVEQPTPKDGPDVQKLIAVLEDQVKWFNVATSQWQQLLALRQNIQVDRYTSSTFIPPNRIFVCGGGPEPCTRHVDNSAYMLEGDGSVRELPHMSTGRNCPGVAWDSVRQALYVFGGDDGNCTCYTANLRASEMFLSKWSPLPDMHQARCRFNPCWYSSIVYLCGGGPNSVETYDPRSNTFVLQDFPLPEESNTTAVVENGTLTVISYSYISKLQQGRLTSQKHEFYYPWSNCTPLVSGGVVYIVVLQKTCHCIDLNTGAVQKEVSLS